VENVVAPAYIKVMLRKFGSVKTWKKPYSEKSQIRKQNPYPECRIRLPLVFDSGVLKGIGKALL